MYGNMDFYFYLFVCLFVCFDISVITLVPEVFSLSEAPKTLVRSFARSFVLVRSFASSAPPRARKLLGPGYSVIG